MVFTEKPDQWLAFHQQSGAEIISEIADQPWLLREYIVRDLNGYRLRIAGPISPEHSLEPIPGDIVIEIRKPTPEEYITIQPQEMSASIETRLERSQTGAVAIVNGTPIAMARVIHDGTGWISIWDVEVIHKYRGQGIGSRLIQELLGSLRAENPGAHVYLFTLKHGFYERLGFGTMTTTSIRL